MKQLLKLFIPLMAISLTSCGSGTSVSESGSSLYANRKMTSSSITYKCKQDNRDATYSINVSQKQALEIRCDFTVDEGALTLSMKDSDGSVFFVNIVVETANFSVPLKDYGKYKIIVHTDDFNGTYQFNWSK